MNGGAVDGRRVLLIAVPVLLANASVPLQGAVDTAIIGNMENAATLGGVGLGAELFSLLFGGFNFLKIGTSGLSAQALGAGDAGRVLNTLARACIIAAGLALLIIALQSPLLALGLALFEGGAETEGAAATYFNIRIWGAPLELANFALLGWFAGQEMTGTLFRQQLVITLSNIALSLVLAVSLGMGLEGVALATVLGNGIGVFYGLIRARERRRALAPDWRPDPARLLKRDELRALMSLNRDLFIRTMLLVGSIAWMMRQGSQLGDLTLAANVVLWQFFVFAAYGLDGFAMAAETLVGQAVGAKDRTALRRAALISTLWSALLAVAASLALWAAFGALIDLMTDLPGVREEARRYALWAAFIPLTGFAAFQLDGIFFGAAAGPQMRNAMLLAAAIYVPTSTILMREYGNDGVWAAMHLFMILRAVTLLWRYPAVERLVAGGGRAG